jgi:DNA-binding winged helix-turn-helix (wHTH) protein
VDTHRHVLTRDGVAIDLLPGYVRVLAHLASRPGEVVSKTALLDLIWGDIAVTDNTVEQAIAAGRKALGDDPMKPRFIETVKRKGYRFVGVVDLSGAPPHRDALDEWKKGRLALETLNAEQLNDAAATFERILTANENYAPAHAAVANACFLKYEVTRPEPTPNYALLERAIKHARHARAAPQEIAARADGMDDSDRSRAEAVA